MESTEKFSLSWNDFETSISGAFQEIRNEKEFFDVTLACEREDDQIYAHKVILSACSPWFRSAFKRNPHQHPLFYLKGVKHSQMMSLLDFMYNGEVSVPQEDLNNFLVVAEELQIKGLTQNNSEKRPVSKSSLSSNTKISEAETKQLLNYCENQLSSTSDTSNDIQEIFAPVENEVYPDVMEVKSELGTIVNVDDDFVEYEQEYVNYGNILPEDGDKNFQKYDELVKNMIRRTEDNHQWQCTVCEKKYGKNYKSNLKEHIEVHHMKHISIICACGNIFNTKRAFRDHCSKIHKEYIFKENIPFQLTGL